MYRYHCPTIILVFTNTVIKEVGLLQKFKTTLILPEGTFYVDVEKFEETDRSKLKSIYLEWRTLCSNLQKMGGRGVNLPEVLSEGLFCLDMKTVRFNDSIAGANTSFDCYRTSNHKRIQVKACSVVPDLTSFGPRSQWDEIYFMDFYREGKWDGTYDIYLIQNDLIYNHMVNSTQTLKQQQLQGRRPRFSIYREIIKARELEPIKTGSIYTPQTV
jgi:Bsp6I restriction endonuclease